MNNYIYIYNVYKDCIFPLNHVSVKNEIWKERLRFKDITCTYQKY